MDNNKKVGVLKMGTVCSVNNGSFTLEEDVCILFNPEDFDGLSDHLRYTDTEVEEGILEDDKKIIGVLKEETLCVINKCSFNTIDDVMVSFNPEEFACLSEHLKDDVNIEQ